MERVEGIEPSTKAWEAFVLPLNYTRFLRQSLLTKTGCPIRTLVISLGSWSNAIIRHPLRAADFVPDVRRDLKFFFGICAAYRGEQVRSPRQAFISNGECMLRLALVITQSAGLPFRFQKAHHRVPAVPAGGLVLHIQEMPRRLDGAEAALRHVLPELPGILGAGVFVPFAVQKQHRHIDLPRGLEVAQAVVVQYLADVKMHLPVFVLGQAAHMLVVETLEQRRQVFADGAVDQVPDAVAVEVAEVVDATLEVVAHWRVDHRRERADHRLFHTPWPLGEGHQGGGAAPGEGQHVLGGEVVDQLQEDLAFDFLRQHLLMTVMDFGATGVGLVVQNHIELRVQAFHGLGEGGRGGQRAVDQDDGLFSSIRAVELRVNPILTLYIQHSDFWPHVVRLLASG